VVARVPRAISQPRKRSGLPLQQLLSYFLELLIDYRAIKAIDGDACLAVVPRLRDVGG